MIKLKGIGHVNLRVADQEVSKRFYRDVLGFVIAEEDPEHGGVFMTLGENFHTLDIGQHSLARNRATAAARSNRAGPRCIPGRQLRGFARGLRSPCRQGRRDPAGHQPHQSAQLLFRRSRRQHTRNLLRAAPRPGAVFRGPGRPGRSAEGQRTWRAAARLAARRLAPPEIKARIETLGAGDEAASASSAARSTLQAPPPATKM